MWTIAGGIVLGVAALWAIGLAIQIVGNWFLDKMSQSSRL
jgi:hypothetical protein